jgi:indolepyruvate ferredoxin oxidoreductase alpha subunit
MGASISHAAGFYHAHRAGREDFPAIVATIGDSTFFHAGIPALINAVVQGARFVLVILDNSTTAMTGHQPTPTEGRTLGGSGVPRLSIPEIVRACGVGFVEVEDPYRLDVFVETLKEAGNHVKEPEGGVAVVIARRPCLMDRGHQDTASWTRYRITVGEKCKGCDFCVKQFECPALVSRSDKEPVSIDTALCTGCGVCVHVCPHHALEGSVETGAKAER